MPSCFVPIVVGAGLMFGCAESVPISSQRDELPSRPSPAESSLDSPWDTVDYETVVVGDGAAYAAELARSYEKVRIRHEGVWIADHHGSFFPVPRDFWRCSGETSDEHFAGLEAQHAGSNLQLRVEVEGILEGPGEYGWLRSCSHLLHVEKLLSIEPDFSEIEP